MISPNMVVANSMATSEIPTLACHPDVVIAAHADRDILKGEIIGANDLIPYDRVTEVSVFALKDIPGGVPIRLEDVTSTPATGTCRAVDKHGRCTNVVGRWTKKQILKGQQVFDQDLFPE